MLIVSVVFHRTLGTDSYGGRGGGGVGNIRTA